MKHKKQKRDRNCNFLHSQSPLEKGWIDTLLHYPAKFDWQYRMYSNRRAYYWQQALFRHLTEHWYNRSSEDRHGQQKHSQRLWMATRCWKPYRVDWARLY